MQEGCSWHTLLGNPNGTVRGFGAKGRAVLVFNTRLEPATLENDEIGRPRRKGSALRGRVDIDLADDVIVTDEALEGR